MNWSKLFEHQTSYSRSELQNPDSLQPFSKLKTCYFSWFGHCRQEDVWIPVTGFAGANIVHVPCGLQLTHVLSILISSITVFKARTAPSRKPVRFWLYLEQSWPNRAPLDVSNLLKFKLQSSRHGKLGNCILNLLWFVCKGRVFAIVFFRWLPEDLTPSHSKRRTKSSAPRGRGELVEGSKV